MLYFYLVHAANIILNFALARNHTLRKKFLVIKKITPLLPAFAQKKTFVDIHHFCSALGMWSNRKNGKIWEFPKSGTPPTPHFGNFGPNCL